MARLLPSLIMTAALAWSTDSVCAGESKANALGNLEKGLQADERAQPPTPPRPAQPVLPQLPPALDEAEVAEQIYGLSNHPQVVRARDILRAASTQPMINSPASRAKIKLAAATATSQYRRYLALDTALKRSPTVKAPRAAAHSEPPLTLSNPDPAHAAAQPGDAGASADNCPVVLSTLEAIAPPSAKTTSDLARPKPRSSQGAEPSATLGLKTPTEPIGLQVLRTPPHAATATKERLPCKEAVERLVREANQLQAEFGPLPDWLGFEASQLAPWLLKEQKAPPRLPSRIRYLGH